MKDQSPGRSAAAYWFSDGLPDIVLGLTVALVSAAALLWQFLAPHPGIFDYLLTTVVFLLYMWKERAILSYLKSKTTYARTGYVQPPEEVQQGAGLTVLSIAPGRPEENVTRFTHRTVMVVYWLFYMTYGLRKPPAAWVMPAVIAGVALLLYVGNRNSEHPYPPSWALILALSGLVFFFTEMPLLLQAPLSGLLAGAWLTAYGLLVQVRYRRKNP